MANDVLLNKAASIERCVKRVREERTKAGANFATDYSHQDAAILNIQRACEAAIDMGQYLVRSRNLGLPQSYRDVFDILANNQVIDTGLADTMKRMVGFRNIAVHEYQKLLLPIVENIIANHLEDFLQYSTQLIKSKS